MSWIEHHARSEKFASEAESARRCGDDSKAIELYGISAKAEQEALEELDKSKLRTLGITLVSAASLFYKAMDFERAQNLAYNWLGNEVIPPFAVGQLRNLLQTIWSEQVRKETGLKFSKGEVRVAIRGGEIIYGGAPLSLIVRKAETIEAFLYRITEFLKNLPLRLRGPAEMEIQRLCRPWVFQTAPGSYQFNVVVQETAQQVIFPEPAISASVISEKFLEVLRASVDDPDATLQELIPDKGYRGTFLKLTRNLAPIGNEFSEMEITRSLDPRPVTIRSESKKNINEAIRRQFPKGSIAKGEEEVTIEGILRGVHLDEDWMEIASDSEHLKIYGVGETVDDVIGPMVNKKVVAQAISKKSGKLQYIDVQLGE